MSLLPRFLIAGCAVAQLLFICPPAQATLRPVAKKSAKATLNAVAANKVAGHPVLKSSAQRGSSVLRAQVLLDRAHFSPGEIDGRFGGNTKSAAAAFNLAKKLKAGAE